MTENSKPDVDVEMKDDAKKDEAKKVEEPSDQFYGKPNNVSNWENRVQEESDIAGEGCQGERLQDDSIINQIIQETQKTIHPVWYRPHTLSLLAWLV